MTQIEYIVQAMRNLGGAATYSQLYKEYEIVSGIVLTPGKRLGLGSLQKIVRQTH